MVDSSFQIGSPLHLIAVGVCLALAIAIAIVGVQISHFPSASRRLRLTIASASLAVWLINTVYWLLPANLDWEQSLPLQLCNLANLIAMLAIWKQWRTMQSFLYYWAIGLSSCAFLTPSLDEGLRSAEFWVFWIYHAMIPVAVAYVLVVDKFRPTWSDCFKTTTITVGYVLLLALINRITGWNYGFVGESKPINPSLIDSLGPYPLRVLWILLLGSIIFIILTLPWIRRRRHVPDS